MIDSPFEIQLENTTGSVVENIPIFNPAMVLPLANAGTTYQFVTPYAASYAINQQLRVTQNSVDLYSITTSVSTPAEVAVLLTTLTGDTWIVSSSVSGGNVWTVTSSINVYTHFQIFGFFTVVVGVGDINEIIFQSNKLTGLCCGDDGIYKSLDGGSTWANVNAVACAKVFTKSSKTAVACLSTGFAFTTDWDDAWLLGVPAGTISGVYRCIHFIDTSVVFCLMGDNGKANTPSEIHKTTDFGTSFSLLKTINASTSVLYEIQQITSDIIICCGSNGVILRSIDGGDNWSTIASGTILDFHVIFNYGNGIIFLGGNEILIKSVDYGASFSLVSIGTIDFDNLQFITELKGYNAEGGVLNLTLDGGVTWTGISGIDNGYCCYAIDGTKIIIGDTGKIYIYE